MTIASTPVPLSEAKARLSELARRVRQQHERITLTRNGEPEAVLVSVDDLEGLEMTLEILGDTEAVARISESLAALGRGEHGADLPTVRQALARRPRADQGLQLRGRGRRGPGRPPALQRDPGGEPGAYRAQCPRPRRCRRWYGGMRAPSLRRWVLVAAALRPRVQDGQTRR